MANILTPLSLWNDFENLLDINAEAISKKESGLMTVETIAFSGRETGKGRVRIAAAFAWNTQSPSTETVLVLPDSNDTIDEKVLEYFVSKGYSALMVDYRGIWENCEFYTHYPEDIEYANVSKCSRYKDFVDDSADKTCWYEWVIVGLYARKYIKERTCNENIAVVGFRDGGEIAWKLGVAEKFSCIVPICAAGWSAYRGISKYVTQDPKMDDERYRFIAGIDSQAYAPYVKCPVLLLCSTNDKRFDYDRAYDTFSRINPEFVKESLISYSVFTGPCIDGNSCNNMFLFLDKNLGKREINIPNPAEVSVETDEQQNLVAKVAIDGTDEIEECVAYLSEDCLDSALREWNTCPVKEVVSETERLFYLNIYEKPSTIFVICHVKYKNGFTVWSKIIVRKLNGKFRNMQKKNKVLYSNTYGTAGFSLADSKLNTIGGLLISDDNALPKLVEKSKGISGLYSPCGLSSFRINNPVYAPSAGNVLSVDVFCDLTENVNISFIDRETGEEYSAVFNVIGGVWQKIIAESKVFKNANGVALDTFEKELKFTINSLSPFAINNFIWL